MLLWIIGTAAVGILLGAILTLWVEWHLFSQPVRSHRLNDQDDGPLSPADSINPIQLPEELLAELETLVSRAANNPAEVGGSSSNNRGNCHKDETLLAVNLLVQFFFRELRSQGPVRRFLLRRINQEMEEVLTRGAVSKIIKGLKIYDIEMGTRAPSIHQIGVSGVGMDDDKKQMESVDFNLSVDYSGGLGIAIDVALAYGKSAFLSAKVSRLKGQVRLSFSRKPYSHWSVAFSSPPQLDVDVTSRVQGRSFSHVTSLVSAQIHKWIQRKHTLPTSRMRHRPFFPHPNQLLLPTSPPTSSCPVIPPVRRGSLEVTVLEVSRLNPWLQGDSIYCTMALDNSPWLSAVPSETDGRILLDIRVMKHRYQHASLGIQFQQQASSSPDCSPTEESLKELKPTGQQQGVSVVEIESGSAAEEAGLRIGDVVLQVDDVTVRSAEDVLRTVNKSKDLFVVIKVDRLPAPRRKGSMRLESMTPSMTYDGSDDKSLATAAASSLDESGLLLHLPGANSNNPPFVKFNNGLDIKRTASHQLDKVIQVGDTLKFQVAQGQRFLNLSVWLTGVPSVEDTLIGKNSGGKSSSTNSPSKSAAAKSNLSNLFKKHSPLHQADVSKDSGKEMLKEVPIGHVNIYLPEVAADCHLNTQGHHISTYQLYPADAKTTLGRQNPSCQQLGFDPRLCYGDVVLSFVYRPDKGDEPPSPEFDLDVVEGLVLPRSSSPLPPSPLPPLIEIARPAVDIVINDAMPMHDFALTQFINVRLCDFCRKKIWLREALQCRNCDLVCHKKCIKRFPDRKWCGLDDIFIPSVPIPIDTPKMVDADDNPFLSAEEDMDELVELESAVDRLQSREHDESLISMARESGKSIYSHLNSGQRRVKISSMLQRLEAATEMEIIRRYELVARLERADGAPWSPEERRKLEKEAESCENRRQALVLLLLHYSSGLQNVEEAEQQQLESKLCDGFS